jgi:hypothetical protein
VSWWRRIRISAVFHVSSRRDSRSQEAAPALMQGILGAMYPRERAAYLRQQIDKRHPQPPHVRELHLARHRRQEDGTDQETDGGG